MKKVYLVGSGIASLGAAVYLIRDAKVPANAITVIDYETQWGGSLDAKGDSQNGYVCRGTRGFDFDAYPCLFDILGSVPGPNGQSLSQHIHDFCDRFTIDTKTRLMRGGRPLDASGFGISFQDQMALASLFLTPERLIGARPISAYFSEEFFSTPFWWMFSTIFAFAKWHSAQEMHRYMHRFFQNVPDLSTLHSIRACPINNQEDTVQPLCHHLIDLGVLLLNETEVTDLMFNDAASAVEGILCRKGGKDFLIDVESDDAVFVTLGSIAAPFDSGSWKLWHALAKKHPAFGNPNRFTSQPDKSTMTTCTLTLPDLEIYGLLQEAVRQTPDVNRITTFIDSPWGMSLIVPKQPWFSNQAPDTRVLWCYGILPQGTGRFIAKTMADASPEEITTELYSLLGFADIPRHVAKTIARKTVLPAGHAQFLCRRPGDRPAIIPDGISNLALLGQYVESEGTTYTMEYSIRTAQKAVYQLFKVAKPETTFYHGAFHPKNMIRAMRAMA